MPSPYLSRPLRSLNQALEDVARKGRGGRDLPPPLLSPEPAAPSDDADAPQGLAGAAEDRSAAGARFQRH